MASAAMASQQPVFPKSHVGFDSITRQIERKLLKRGFQFNVICVGELGAPPRRPQKLTGSAKDKRDWASRR